MSFAARHTISKYNLESHVLFLDLLNVSFM